MQREHRERLVGISGIQGLYNVTPQLMWWKGRWDSTVTSTLTKAFNQCKLVRFICVKATAVGRDRIRLNRTLDLIEIAFSWCGAGGRRSSEHRSPVVASSMSWRRQQVVAHLIRLEYTGDVVHSVERTTAKINFVYLYDEIRRG